jgi:hypothetical protein
MGRWGRHIVTADTLPGQGSSCPAKPLLAAGPRRRLKPFLLLLPSLVFLGAFTNWPVVSVAVDSLYGRRLG